MEVTLTKISEHNKTKSGTSCANGTTMNVTHKGHAMYTLVHGKGSNRVSETMHCSDAQAQSRKQALQGKD